jgi:PKD repeat protein
MMTMGSKCWPVLVLAIAIGAYVGCGDGGAPEAPAPVPVPTTLPAAATEDATEDAYELDVIAEAEPDEGEPPLAVKFLGYVEEDEGGPWTFAGDFGDGQRSTEQNPAHTYTKVGDYTAVLSVTDARGNTGTDEIDVFVEDED